MSTCMATFCTAQDACCSVGTPLENKDIFDWDGFTLNRFDEGRAGGALADNDPATKNKKTQRKGVSRTALSRVTFV